VAPLPRGWKVTDCLTETPRRSAFSLDLSEAGELTAALARDTRLVVGLCAAWCNTCGEFREAFDELAQETSHTSFVWIDIEDDAEFAGEIEVENFPTIAVFHGDRLVHFGTSLPQKQIVVRLLASFDETSKTVSASAAVTGLRERIAARTVS
jgi:thioredoxin 1